MRPYVVISLDSSTGLTVGSNVTVPLSLENVGNTPVYRGKLYPDFEVTSDRKFHRALHQCDASESSDGPGQVFGRKSSYTPSSDFALTKSQIDLIAAGAVELGLFARFCYSDIFEENNWTDVCLHWHDKDGQAIVYYCDILNDAVSNEGTLANFAYWFSSLLRL